MGKQNVTISIIGAPNVGKSTLLNYIIGQKISIVTPKVQTTRVIIRGIRMIDNVQLVFLDTPGIFSPKTKLDKYMVKSAWNSIAGADYILLLLDATKKDFMSFVTEVVKQIDVRKLIIAINKVDIVSETKLERYKENLNNFSTYYISAINGKNIPNLLEYFTQNANNPGWYYNPDEITTIPSRFLAEEITREQLYLSLQQELPYNLTVTTEQWQEKEERILIKQRIVVAKKSHKSRR